MQLVLEVLCAICLLSGSFFCLVGGVGLNRMPDFFTRGHAAGVTDTLGAGLVLVGLMFISGPLNIFKLLMILIFLLVTSPTSSHALAKAAWTHGLRPWTRGGPLELSDALDRADAEGEE